ncbi:hypothetical protein [Anaerobaca lacustris]|uniref:Dockerin domain-containing protein n=1 Tax=Anaerobaca lacustris TaxID=3044600 RepID=A0AAW6TUH1_9BACT|nr:hypothetical protein [Sedimentisphaerales bacterium M17dextr]
MGIVDTDVRGRRGQRVGRPMLDRGLYARSGSHTARISPRAIASFSLILAGLLGSTVAAGVSAHVFLGDEATPLALADPNVPGVYRDIMVGTRLVIIVTSDMASGWDGALWLSRANLDTGVISARGDNPAAPFFSYEGSCLPSAGTNALVTAAADARGLSFHLLSSWNAVPGPWFVLDYQAEAVGTCSVGLYGYAPSADIVAEPNPYDPGDPPPFEAILIQVLSFHHVASRDYDADTLVNFADFARLAARWRQSFVFDPNEAMAVDLNGDDRIDVCDLALFSDYWLARTEVIAAGQDSDTPDAMP